MRLRSLAWVALAAAGVLATSQARADSTQTFTGTLDETGDEHVLLELEVPAGTKEIQIEHDDLSADDIIDWGLWSPEGFRGWGGGNTEPAIVGELASSRSYLIGPITPGTWKIDLGKAKLVGGAADYAITVTLRDAPTLEPQTERSPYAPPGPVISSSEGWYAGDFHVHSKESGDASATFQQIVDLARERGLDFVELSDHNTTAQLDFYESIQGGVTDLLLIPGVEYTTYHGHANGIGATAFVDFRLGLPDVTAQAASAAFHDQGALFSINHPAFDLGDACIGCAWEALDMAPGEIDGIEVATAGSAIVFFDQTVKIWETLAGQGHHLAALGGSDDHSAGENPGAFGTPLGSPATMVYASELSTEAIKDGIRQGRTVVKMRGPDDPMAELAVHVGGAAGAQVDARITGGGGLEARWVVDGVAQSRFTIDADPFEVTLDVAPRADEQRRVRLEVYDGATPVTLTSHVWIASDLGTTEPLGGGVDGCSVAPEKRAPWEPWALVTMAFGWIMVRRASSPKRSERA
jgi:hypothetical protein